MGARAGFVEWFDNVNRNFGCGNVKMADGVYKEGNWTAKALHACSIPSHEINRKMMDGNRRRRDIGLPDDLFTSPKNKKWLKSMMKKCDLEGMYFRHGSLVNVWDVRRVPLKPSRSDVASNPKWAAGLERNDLHRFHPCALLEPNIGCNQGLWDVMWSSWNDGAHPWAKSKTLRMVVADSNIFKRMIKVSGWSVVL